MHTKKSLCTAYFKVYLTLYPLTLLRYLIKRSLICDHNIYVFYEQVHVYYSTY